MFQYNVRMEDNGIWKMISEVLSGEASEETREVLNERMQQNEGLNCFLQVMQAFWNSPPCPKKQNEFNDVFEKITARLAVKYPAFLDFNKKLN